MAARMGERMGGKGGGIGSMGVMESSNKEPEKKDEAQPSSEKEKKAPKESRRRNRDRFTAEFWINCDITDKAPGVFTRGLNILKCIYNRQCQILSAALISLPSSPFSSISNLPS